MPKIKTSRAFNVASSTTKRNLKSSSSSAQVLTLEQMEYGHMTRYSMQRCLYCRKVFFNRFQLYMHNSQHIFIPLHYIPASVSQQLQFTSQKLVTESSSEYPESQLTCSSELKRKDVRNESKLNLPINSSKEPNIIEIYKNNIIRDILTDCKVNLGENIPIKLTNTENSSRNQENDNKIEISHDLLLDTYHDSQPKLNYDSHSQISHDLPKKMNIPEAQSNLILADFTSQCSVKVNDFFEGIKEELTDDIITLDDSDVSDSESRTFVNIPLNCQLIGSKPSRSGQKNFKEDTSFKSGINVIHYDDLIMQVSQTVSCQYCQKKFDNMYDCLQHHLRHVYLKPLHPKMCVKCHEHYVTPHQQLCFKCRKPVKKKHKHKKKTNIYSNAQSHNSNLDSKPIAATYKNLSKHDDKFRDITKDFETDLERYTVDDIISKNNKIKPARVAESSEEYILPDIVTYNDTKPNSKSVKTESVPSTLDYEAIDSVPRKRIQNLINYEESDSNESNEEHEQLPKSNEVHANLPKRRGRPPKGKINVNTKEHANETVEKVPANKSDTVNMCPVCLINAFDKYEVFKEIVDIAPVHYCSSCQRNVHEIKIVKKKYSGHHKSSKLKSTVRSSIIFENNEPKHRAHSAKDKSNLRILTNLKKNISNASYRGKIQAQIRYLKSIK